MSTVETVTDLVTTQAIQASSIVAIAAVAAAAVLADRVPRRLARIAAPTITAIATTVAILGSDVSLDRYSPWNAPVEIGFLGVLAISISTSVVGLTFSQRERPGVGRDASLLLAGAVIGIYLCVPETDLLRLLPAAIAIPAVAITLGTIEPFGAVSATTISGALGWIALVDGSSRSSALVGSFGCLAAIALATLWSPAGSVSDSETWSRRWGRVTVYVIAMIGCSRIAGLQSSGVAAVVALSVVLVASAAALRLDSARLESADRRRAGLGAGRTDDGA